MIEVIKAWAYVKFFLCQKVQYKLACLKTALYIVVTINNPLNQKNSNQEISNYINDWKSFEDNGFRIKETYQRSPIIG
jgi:hypothetical protein